MHFQIKNETDEIEPSLYKRKTALKVTLKAESAFNYEIKNYSALKVVYWALKFLQYFQKQGSNLMKTKVFGQKLT